MFEVLAIFDTQNGFIDAFLPSFPPPIAKDASEAKES